MFIVFLELVALENNCMI